MAGAERRRAVPRCNRELVESALELIEGVASVRALGVQCHDAPRAARAVLVPGRDAKLAVLLGLVLDRLDALVERAHLQSAPLEVALETRDHTSEARLFVVAAATAAAPPPLRWRVWGSSRSSPLTRDGGVASTAAAADSCTAAAASSAAASVAANAAAAATAAAERRAALQLARREVARG